MRAIMSRCGMRPLLRLPDKGPKGLDNLCNWYKVHHHDEGKNIRQAKAVGDTERPLRQSTMQARLEDTNRKAKQVPKVLRDKHMGRVGPIDVMNDPAWIAFNGPGVYLFNHEDRGYLYIGLAKSMFKRLNHYRIRLSEDLYESTAGSMSSLLRIPPPEKVSVTIYLCGDYSEARQLEASLIKQHRPHFNILHCKTKRSLRNG